MLIALRNFSANVRSLVVFDGLDTKRPHYLGLSRHAHTTSWSRNTAFANAHLQHREGVGGKYRSKKYIIRGKAVQTAKAEDTSTLNKTYPPPAIGKSHSQGDIHKSLRKELQPENESLVSRLIDQQLAETEHGLHDVRLWLDLLRFQQRHYGDCGVRVVLGKIREKQYYIPAEGSQADEIWYRVVHASFRNASIWTCLRAYVLDLRRRGKRVWTKFYIIAMVERVKDEQHVAIDWHKNIKELSLPQLGDYQQLFSLCLRRDLMSTFENIYHNYPIRQMYSTVIPRLCTARRYSQAFKWHIHLLRADDLPLDFNAISPLLFHYSSVGDEESFSEIVTTTLASGVKLKIPVSEPSSSQQITTRVLSSQEVGLPPYQPLPFSDRLCARLFATRIFKVDSVINGLELMGVTAIGPLSLREIVSRDDCDPTIVCGHLNQLRHRKIRLDNSKYCTIIRQAAITHNISLLESIIKSDAHPDTYEDFNLQENLLAMYMERGDKAQVDRVLAVTLLEVPESLLNMQRQNLLLRTYLSLGWGPQITVILRDMHHAEIPLTPKSSRHLRVLYLSPTTNSRYSLEMITHTNLDVITNAMKSTLIADYPIPIKAWRGVLQRLGTMHRLDDFRNLALWLTRWYTRMPPVKVTAERLQRSLDHMHVTTQASAASPHLAMPSRPARTWVMSDGLAKQGGTRPAQDISQRESAVTAVSPSEPPNLTSHLFPKAAQQAIVALGFQEATKLLPSTTRRSPQTRSLDCTWGLRLLVELRDMGVPMETGAIAEAYLQRLQRMIYQRIPAPQRLLRRTRSFQTLNRRDDHRAEYEFHVQQLKAVWGDEMAIERAMQSPKVQKHGRKWARKWARNLRRAQEHHISTETAAEK